jgi:hypothetical protein
MSLQGRHSWGPGVFDTSVAKPLNKDPLYRTVTFKKRKLEQPYREPYSHNC